MKESLKNSPIAIILGGRSSERDISLKTGLAIFEGLEEAGYKHVFKIDPADSNFISLLKELKVEAAFIALHGRYGEDGSIQGLLECMNIPYTGSGITGNAIAIDKDYTKQILMHHQIVTPYYMSVKSMDDVLNGSLKDKMSESNLTFPLIVKPAKEGSTLGLKKVFNEAEMVEALREAFKYDDKVLIEECIIGMELTVAILNGEAFPSVEIVPKSGFYDFASKYTKGLTDFFCPARLSIEDSVRISNRALQTAVALGCDAFCRVDIILKDKVPYVLEVNTMPGFTGTSLFPRAAKAAGIDFPSLVSQLIESASLKTIQKSEGK